MACTALAVQAPVWAQRASEEDMLVDKARFTLGNFLSAPDMQWFRDHMKEARGILIVPQFIKGAFIIGGSGGCGLLVVRDEKTNEWSYPAFFYSGWCQYRAAIWRARFGSGVVSHDAKNASIP